VITLRTFARPARSGPPAPCVSSAERVLSGGRAEPVDDAAGHVVTPERVETLEHVGVLHAGPEVGADQVERAGAHHARGGDINGPSRNLRSFPTVPAPGLPFRAAVPPPPDTAPRLRRPRPQWP
jgi:hypothetical protein